MFVYGVWTKGWNSPISGCHHIETTNLHLLLNLDTLRFRGTEWLCVFSIIAAVRASTFVCDIP